MTPNSIYVYLYVCYASKEMFFFSSYQPFSLNTTPILPDFILWPHASLLAINAWKHRSHYDLLHTILPFTAPLLAVAFVVGEYVGILNLCTSMYFNMQRTMIGLVNSY